MGVIVISHIGYRERSLSNVVTNCIRVNPRSYNLIEYNENIVFAIINHFLHQHPLKRLVLNCSNRTIQNSLEHFNTNL